MSDKKVGRSVQEHLNEVVRSGLLEIRIEPRASILSTTKPSPYWRAHQFLLEGTKLICLNENKVARTIELNQNCKAVQGHAGEMGRAFSFIVSLGFAGPGNKVILNATDNIDRDEWISAINDVCTFKNVKEMRKSVSSLRMSHTFASSPLGDEFGGESGKSSGGGGSSDNLASGGSGSGKFSAAGSHSPQASSQAQSLVSGVDTPVAPSTSRAIDRKDESDPSSASVAPATIGPASSSSSSSRAGAGAGARSPVVAKKDAADASAKPTRAANSQQQQQQQRSPPPKSDDGALGVVMFDILVVLLTIGVQLLPFFSVSEGVDTYMDELFHIPQAQKYCQGIFYPEGWNSKITTLPGAYMVSFGIKTALNYGAGVYLHAREALGYGAPEAVAAAASSWSYSAAPAAAADVFAQVTGWDSCSVTALRTQSLVAGCLIFAAAFRARRSLICVREGQWQASEKGYVSLLLAMAVTLYPVSAFYFFLYYTDSFSSLFLVLTVWLASAAAPKSFPSRISRLYLIFFSSAAAIATRQTNAVWVAFLAGAALIPKRTNNSNSNNSNSNSTVFIAIGSYVNNALFGGATFAHLKAILLMAPVGAFAYFVFAMNDGSIVLGDKEAHTPVLHLAMPLHALAIASFLLFVLETPTTTTTAAASTEAKHAIAPAANAPGKMVMHALGLAATCGMLGYNSLSHPFLLSDNRHYTFYVWQRFLSDEKLRLGLGAVYYWLIQRGLTQLVSANGVLWVIGYVLAVFVSLTPTPLLEPRYFTPAVLIALIAAPTAGRNPSKGYTARVLGTLLVFVAVNAATWFVFLNHPFVDAAGQTSRFMY
jgi:alpha-1,2-glucosyltransferase